MVDIQTLGQLGAGVIVLVVLKEVFAFVKFWQNGKTGNGNGNGSNSGSKSPEYWRSEMRQASREIVEMMVLPILDKQTEILARMNDKITEIAVIQRPKR